jgi:peroxiredoxin Q/BCP
MAPEPQHELAVGDPAPDIQIDDDQGRPFRLSDLKGKNVVLFFYPKADTPGCTKEACQFRDSSAKYSKADTVIVGISADKAAAQAKFKTKFDLPFALLADTEHKAIDAFGVWKQKSFMGKKFLGIERSTFIIDKQGKIARIFRKVSVDGHADEVYHALQQL